MAYLASLLDGYREPTSLATIRPGDVIRRGMNRCPDYRVIAVSNGRAWVRDVQYGTDAVVPLEDFRKI
jgi:hypothetical protein